MRRTALAAPYVPSRTLRALDGFRRSRGLSAAVVALMAPSSALAFCGTYVGGAGSELYADVSEVAIVRKGTKTTLTMANDVHGDFSEFAVVLPVPEVVQEDMVNVVDPAVFDRLDQYSEPRLVEYVCEDFEEQADTGFLFDAGGGDGGDGGSGGVDVEAEYIVGEYEIVVLSAEQSASLFAWLDENGYSVPAESQTMLQEYIDSGMYFLAAKVYEDAGVEPGDTLSPLQLIYDSESFSIPIRLGTLNARGPQDLIVYAINSYDDGRVAISSYPELEIEDECLWSEQADEDFGAFYVRLFEQTWEANDKAAWVTEYAWGGSGCDPCTGTPPDEQDLYTLGYEQDYRTVYDVYFSRLHMRYTADQAKTDVGLYHTGLDEQTQQRYIRHESYLEDLYPHCELGWDPTPGSCDPEDETSDGDFVFDDEDDEGGLFGCSASGTAAVGLWALVALGVRRRDQR